MSTTHAVLRYPQVASDPPKRWTTAEFDRLVGLGVIEEGCDTYLWEGQIVTPMPEYRSDHEVSATTAAPQYPEVAFDPPKRWTTAEFDRLVGLGAIEEGCDTYLWEGQIVTPMPEYPPHFNAFRCLLVALMVRFLEPDWIVGPSQPLTLEDGTRPQPDLLITRGPSSRYRLTLATPSDVALLIEVSVSTYSRDSGERYRKYAKVGIPQYWIVNVAERRVEVYLNPQVAEDGTSAYQSRTDYQLDQSIPLNVTLEGLAVTGEIAVMDILRDSLAPENPQGPA